MKRHLTPEKEEALRAWKDKVEAQAAAIRKRGDRPDVDAIYLIPEARRYYPHQWLAGPILGFCDIDGNGLSGLEHLFNEELYGKPFIEFVHPDDRERTARETERLRHGGTTVSFEDRYLCRDGSYKNLLWSSASDPEARLFYAVARDITQIRRVEEDLHGRCGRTEVAVRGVQLFTVSYHGHFVAVSLANGEMLWSRDISCWSGSVVADDTIYVTDDKGDLWAIAGRNGATLWKQTALHARRLAPPVTQGDYLIIGDYDGYLHWIAREDGHIAARVRVEDWDYYWPLPSEVPENSYREDRTLLATPRVAGDTVYAMEKRGMLAVFQVSPKHP